MKLITTLTVIVLILTVCAPAQVSVLRSPHSATSLLTLDVCNPAGAALSAHAEVPILPEDRYSILFTDVNAAYISDNHILNSSLLSFPHKRPPKV